MDGSHPNDAGMVRQADLFAKALKPLLQREDRTARDTKRKP